MPYTCLLWFWVTYNLCSSQWLCNSHLNPPPPPNPIGGYLGKAEVHLVFAWFRFPGSWGMHFFHGFTIQHRGWAGAWRGFHLLWMNGAWRLEGGGVHSEFFPHKAGFHCISLTVKVNVPGIPKLGTLENRKHKLDRNLPITNVTFWPG